jgi:Domain of unknown function (DUF1833)
MGLEAAIREAYATSANNVVYLETLEISHPLVTSLYLVRDRVDHVLGIGGGVTKTFVATGFQFNLPSAGENGLQELTLRVDNVDRRASDFVNSVKGSNDPVQVIYRPYLHTEPNTPQMNPPLRLFLTDIVITAVDVTGRATFADVLNRRFLSELYVRRRFPAL